MLFHHFLRGSSSYHLKKNLNVIWWMTTKLTIVILSQCMCILNYVVHLKLMMLYGNCISIKPGFPSGLDGKESTYDAGDLSSFPGLGSSPGEGNVILLQYFCLENPMNRGTWQTTVHGVTKSQMWLSNYTYISTKQEEEVSSCLLAVSLLPAIGNHWSSSCHCALLSSRISYRSILQYVGFWGGVYP